MKEFRIHTIYETKSNLCENNICGRETEFVFTGEAVVVDVTLALFFCLIEKYLPCIQYFLSSEFSQQMSASVPLSVYSGNYQLSGNYLSIRLEGPLF